MSQTQYIEAEDLIEIVDAIRGFDYVSDEEVPDYDAEQSGVDNYFSLVDRIKNDLYYPDIYSKATALFLQLNTSHYFSNGNKRIAAFSLISFLNKNEFFEIGLSKAEYTKLFSEILGVSDLEDFDNFGTTDFALYNLAITTAQFTKNGVDFDTGKHLVESFLRKTFCRF